MLDLVWEDSSKQSGNITFTDLVNMVLNMRGSNPATVKARSGNGCSMSPARSCHIMRQMSPSALLTCSPFCSHFQTCLLSHQVA